MDQKQFIEQAVDQKEKEIVELSDKIFDYAETGFHEFRSAKLYQQMLEAEGFSVEMGICGMPTAFQALRVFAEGGGRQCVDL